MIQLIQRLVLLLPVVQATILASSKIEACQKTDNSGSVDSLSDCREKLVLLLAVESKSVSQLARISVDLFAAKTGS